MTVPLEVQKKCVERELRMRERAYPRWIAQGKMTQAKADEEFATVQAVLETVEAAAQKERLL